MGWGGGGGGGGMVATVNAAIVSRPVSNTRLSKFNGLFSHQLFHPVDRHSYGINPFTAMRSVENHH